MAESVSQLHPTPAEGPVPGEGPTSDEGPRTPAADRPAVREPLWRHMLGDRLRRLRHGRGETLGETAARAGVSPQYLSEVERGVKEPSSEVIAAIAGALGVTLLDLTLAVADELRPVPADLSPRTASRVALALAA